MVVGSKFVEWKSFIQGGSLNRDVKLGEFETPVKQS